MSHTLVFRLAGPMQSWGLQSRFSIRDTAREPTKSGVIGLICAALGRDRSEPIDDLARLRMGIRVLCEGQPRKDYHTAQNVLRASATIRPGKLPGKGDIKDTELSTRHYLADAWFLAGLESDDSEPLELIDRALAHPRWPLFLGRKAFAPGLPLRLVDEQGVAIGLSPAPLASALQAAVDPLWNRQARKDRDPGRNRYVLDAGVELAGLRVVARRMTPDHPVSFATRRFLPRDILVAYPSSGKIHVPQQTHSQST